MFQSDKQMITAGRDDTTVLVVVFFFFFYEGVGEKKVKVNKIYKSAEPPQKNKERYEEKNEDPLKCIRDISDEIMAS